MIATLLTILAFGQTAQPALNWEQVGKSKHESISGLARFGADRFVMVLDNKKEKQEKLCWLSKVDGAWKREKIEISDPNKLATHEDSGNLVIDLEGICRIPGHENEVLVIGDRSTDQGWIYRFKLEGDKATLMDAVKVPDVNADSDYEAIDLVKTDSHFILFWGDRGTPTRSGTVSAAFFTLASEIHFGPTATLSIKTPWPTGELARSVSDLRVVGNDILVSSASDPGDSGPFDSAVYTVASFSETAKTLTLKSLDTPVEICKAPGHKIEAIDFDSTTKQWTFGTDDENLGGWIAFKKN